MFALRGFVLFLVCLLAVLLHGAIIYHLLLCNTLYFVSVSLNY